MSSARMRCGTASRPICSKTATTFARFSSCSAIGISAPRRAICASPPPKSAPPLPLRSGESLAATRHDRRQRAEPPARARHVQRGLWRSARAGVGAAAKERGAALPVDCLLPERRVVAVRHEREHPSRLAPRVRAAERARPDPSNLPGHLRTTGCARVTRHPWRGHDPVISRPRPFDRLPRDSTGYRFIAAGVLRHQLRREPLTDHAGAGVALQGRGASLGWL